MIIEIDPSLPQPLFEQVAQQIKFSIAAGAVHVNEMVPSVRVLSRQLAINPNTVARAYRQLQDEEILIPQRGVGLVIAANAQGVCRKLRKEFFKERFQTFLDEATRSKLSEEELSDILKVV